MASDADKIVRFLTEGVELSEGTIIIYNGNERQEIRSGDQGSPPQQTQATVNGKKWRFTVNRNDQGQITDLDVEQL